jgi:uncharacterized phage infection (PIP) family protein YhgE
VLVPNLDLVMTGDCISAVTALGNTERAVRSLQSRAGSGVGVAISVGGARAAAKDLGSVSSALASTSAAAAGVNRTPIAGGLTAGAAAARGLTGALAGTTRQATTSTTAAAVLASRNTVLAGSMRSAQAAAVGVGAAARAAATGNRSLAGAMASVGAQAAATRRHQSAMLDELARGGNLAAAQRAGIVSAADVAGAQRQRALVTAGKAYASEMAANGRMVAAGYAPASAAMRGATRDAAALAAGTRDLSRATSGLNAAATAIPPSRYGAMGAIRGAVADFRSEYMRSAESERAGIGGRYPTPPVVPPRGGGGGGGGGGGDDEERRAAAAGKAGAEFGKGLGTVMTAGLAVGIATNAAYAKHALDAVNVTISETPGLADSAKDAADELGNGIRDITTGVNMDAFADQFERLGTAQRALGQIQGQIGMQNLAVKLETEAEAADTQTRALARMAPAMDAAIRGSSNLQNALLEGISNPQVVNGVQALGESLAKPEIKKGLADITTGATGAALVWGKVAADVSGAASNIAGKLFGGQNVTDMSSALFGGGAIAALSKGGIANRLGFGALGASAILGAQDLEARGQGDMVTPMITNQVLGALLGGLLTKGNMLGVVGGGLLGQGATMAAPSMSRAITGALAGGSIGFGLGGPVGAGIGALAGGAGGATLDELAPGGWLAPSPENAPGIAGWLRDFGKTSRENTPGVGDVVGLGTDYVANVISPDTAPKEGPVQPGPKQPEAPKSQAEQLQDRQKDTRQRVGEQQRQSRQDRYEKEARAGSGYPAGAPLPPISIPAAPAAATQQLSQSAQQATQSVQGLGQALPQVAQQAQQLPVAMRPVSQTVQTLPNNAAQQMNQAASSISQSAQQVGQQIPPAISTGIVKQTPKVCNAAADMGNSMVNCTARALQSASPSKRFIALGESTGDGAAIGVNNSAGGAVDAVGSMTSGMLAAVGALGSGVQAASDGAVPMAESGGLMVGYVWARSVATGADSVLRSADFMSASMPTISSALAKATLGQLGLLGVAGSGASISKTAGGGIVSMPAPVINATVQVVVDGAGPMRVISQQVVDSAFDELTSSFSRQRG